MEDAHNEWQRIPIRCVMPINKYVYLMKRDGECKVCIEEYSYKNRKVEILGVYEYAFDDELSAQEAIPILLTISNGS